MPNLKMVLLQKIRWIFSVSFIFNLMCYFSRPPSLLCSKLEFSKHILSFVNCVPFSEIPGMAQVLLYHLTVFKKIMALNVSCTEIRSNFT